MGNSNNIEDNNIFEIENNNIIIIYIKLLDINALIQTLSTV